MKSFNVLKDQAKINKLPSRVKIVSAKRDYTLQEGLKDYGMPQARFNELSILNGMELTDKLKTGMLFKVIEERRNK